MACARGDVVVKPIPLVEFVGGPDWVEGVAFLRGTSAPRNNNEGGTSAGIWNEDPLRLPQRTAKHLLV